MNRHNILVLGARGSGKTSFLASMYDKLSVQSREIGFFLETTDRERLILVNTYRQMEDPTKEWPLGTVEVSEWKFTCAMHAEDNKYQLLEFAYLDYAGGRLTDIVHENSNSPFSIDKAAEDATAILVLLDGLKILRQLEGRLDRLSSPIHNDLRYILPIVERLEPKPLHFVITKWDVLENKKHSLERVRKMLFENEKFAAIVEQRRTQKSPVRLIPTSAVGKDFAILTEDNTMKKSQNVIAKPFQVEVPVACALIDGFQFVLCKLKKKEIDDMINSRISLRKYLQKIKRVLKIGSDLPVLPPAFQLPESVLKVLCDIADKKVASNITELEYERENVIKSIKNYDSAMQGLIKCYDMLIYKLERDFPESDLYKV